ncbi:hypothetical protein GCM10009504_05170 [Pseudomonas laurentiana]|nr:hypothetical protein GCM10009504_05170 [Pseudomonas laurentiana]
MLGDMVAQARDNQDGSGGMQSFHVGTYAQGSQLGKSVERFETHSNHPSPWVLYIERQ